MSQWRLQRVAESIKQEVSRIVDRELRDPRLHAVHTLADPNGAQDGRAHHVELVTITDVEVSADLRHARIYFSVLGDERAVEECREGLTSAAGYIRGALGHRLRLKYTPELSFHYDRSAAHAQHIENLLANLRGDSSSESADE